MIYFKCSQCGEKMEAPASLKGQLLSCPKCNLHQTVPTYLQKKNVFLFIIGSLILLGIIVGIGLLVKEEIEDQHRKESEAAKAQADFAKDICQTIGPWLGAENIDRAYAAMIKLGKETPTLGPTTMLAMLAAYADVRPKTTLEHAMEMVKMAEPLRVIYGDILPIKIAGQLEKIYPEKGMEDIFSMTVLILKNTWMHKEQIEESMQAVHTMVDMGISPDKALATMLACFNGEQPAKCMQAVINLIYKLGEKTETSEEPNIEPNVTEQATFKRLMNQIDSESTNGFVSGTTRAVSKNEDYSPDYSDTDKWTEEQDRKEAKQLELTLEEYRALQRSGKLPNGSREFAPETLARNRLYRSLFDVSQGNKRKSGPNAYLTPKEIQGRQKFLAKYKRLAHLQLRKEHFLEKPGQEDEVEKINRLIEKTSQNK
jgi:hypothetical protein